MKATRGSADAASLTQSAAEGLNRASAIERAPEGNVSITGLSPSPSSLGADGALAFALRLPQVLNLTLAYTVYIAQAPGTCKTPGSPEARSSQNEVCEMNGHR